MYLLSNFLAKLQEAFNFFFSLKKVVHCIGMFCKLLLRIHIKLSNHKLLEETDVMHQSYVTTTPPPHTHTHIHLRGRVGDSQVKVQGNYFLIVPRGNNKDLTHGSLPNGNFQLLSFDLHFVL